MTLVESDPVHQSGELGVSISSDGGSWEEDSSCSIGLLG